MAARALRLAHRGDWRVAPENTLAAFRAALARPACDGLEFDVRAVRRRRPGRLPRRHARAGAGPSRAGRRPQRGGSCPGVDVPTLAEVARRRRPTAVPRRRAQGRDRARPGRRAGRRSRAGAAQRGRLVVRAGGARGRRPPGAGLAALAQRGGPRSLGRRRRARRSAVAASPPTGTRSTRMPWRLASAAGLEVAAWTVRRRATFDRLAELGVVAVCVEAAALDG